MQSVSDHNGLELPQLHYVPGSEGECVSECVTGLSCRAGAGAGAGAGAVGALFVNFSAVKNQLLPANGM